MHRRFVASGVRLHFTTCTKTAAPPAADVADVEVDVAGVADLAAAGADTTADAGTTAAPDTDLAEAAAGGDGAAVAPAGAGGAGAGAGAGGAGAGETRPDVPAVEIDYASLSQEGGDKVHDVSVLVGSWNVGNKQPSDDFAPFIPAGGGGYGIIVVGGQEAKYPVKGPGDKVMQTPSVAESKREAAESKSEATGSARAGINEESAEPSASANHFFRILQRHVGPEYDTVATVMLWEMRLIVLARRELVPHITNINKAWEATGIMHICGNKGGLVIQMDLFETSLCFVSCHLAAHARHLTVRNQNVEEVLSEVRLGNKELDLDAQCHHLFWLGDLNYRVQLNVENPKKKIEHAEHFAAVKKLVDAGDWAALYAKDQLVHEMRANRVFVGFQEAPPTFAPTFKVERKPVLEYKDKRVPSYCDRVLWKSMPGRDGDLTNTSFEAFPSIATSDHKPVSAGFTVRCRTPIQVGLGTDEQYPLLVITKLEGKDLYAADPGGKSDPYIKFFSDPPGLLTAPEEKPPQTAIVFRTLNPKFDDDKVPHMRTRITTKAQFNKSTLALCIWDFDRVSADDRMGQALLPLRDFVGAKTPQPFNIPVSRAGVGRGSLKGMLQVLWPGDEGYTTDLHAVSAKGCCTIS